MDHQAEAFTPEERTLLAPHFTDLDGPVFALVNLPEVVKGALFARYSRSAKSLRRLFLDEFAGREETRLEASPPPAVGLERAEKLYERVFFEYGDDSVAQLGGVHLACEQASQPLAKVLEWGRLAAYLEQSTRYVPYDDKPGGRWRYHVPDELGGPSLGNLKARYERTLDAAFETYSRWLEPVQDLFRDLHPKDPADSDFVYRSTIRAKAFDTLRGLLPAATRTNVGIYATAQAYENLLLRMRGHPLAEVRSYAGMILRELRKVIPAFLTRVDLPDRGEAWTRYIRETETAASRIGSAVLAGSSPEPRPMVTLTDFDPDGETKVVAAALYPHADLPDDQLLAAARKMPAADRAAVLAAYVGERRNRRHRPGRAFERTSYRFDVLCDYGAFRDLQRHRLLTLQWQPLTPHHGYDTPPEVEAVGASNDWSSVMADSAELYEAMLEAGLETASQYSLAMAYRIRFSMDMNAREAMHLIELRSSPQGHPTYRAVAQAMHRLIADQAGHAALAAAMSFVDHSAVDLGRLDAERRSEARRRQVPDPAT